MRVPAWLRNVRRPLLVWSLVVGSLAVFFGSQLPERPVKTEEKAKERVEEGKSIPVKYYTEIYWWKGAWPSFGICLVLLGIGGLVTRPVSEEFRSDDGRAPPGAGRWIFLSVLAAVVLGAVLNAPRLSLGLWDDETYWMRKYVVGNYERNVETGEVEHDEPTWLETMFDARRLTNHTLYSVAGRVSHSFHSGGDGPQDPYFTEWLLRLPAYIGGLVGLAGVAWCLFVYGFYRAAVIAPFMLLAHAWFTRMGVDARGYSFVLAFAPLVLATLGMAVRTGKWRWWIALIASESALFLSFFGSVYFLFGANLTALLLILFRADTSMRDRLTLFWRYTGVTGLFTLVGIFFFLPCLPQITTYMETGRLDGDMDKEWFQDVGAYLVSGAPWFDDEPVNPLSYHLADVVADYGLLAWLAIAVVVIAAIGGIARIACSRSWPILVVLLVTLPLAYLHNYLEGRRLIFWYAVIMLPGLAVLASTGATWLGRTIKNQVLSRSVTVICGVLLVASVLALASRYNHLLRTRSFVPLRESVEVMGKEVTNPKHPDFEKGVISVGFHQPSIAYDPGVWWYRDGNTSADQLRERIAVAEKSNRPLYVNFGLYDQAELLHPELMSLVTNPEVFEEIAVLYGLYGASTRHVYRYKPGSLAEQ